MEKKQTAVEWLAEQLVPKAMLTYDAITYNAIQQAKQMEKEQHFESYRQGNVFLDSDSLNFKGSFDEYYNETYGGNNE
jgi:hypothetical protein